MYSFVKHITRHLFFLVFLITSASIRAQFFLPDTIIVCGSDSMDIEMGYGISTSNILTDIDSATFTTVSLANDKFSPKINIGFSFEFYGIDYTKVVMSSNSFLSFNEEYHHAFTPLIIDIALPNSSNTISANKVKNAILAPWHDIDPSQGGILDYTTIGTSPDRIFIARWMDVPHFTCTDLTSCTAIFLYENGDFVETHIAAKPTCTIWNTGQAIHALQNDSGTVAEIVTDPYNNLPRDYPNSWTTGIEGVRFTPEGSNDYTHDFIDFIPFVPVSDIIWTDGLGDTIGIGDSINWNPDGSTNDIDIIYIETNTCSTDLMDSIVIISDPSLAIIGPLNALCITADDSLSINISYADSVLWNTGETSESIGTLTEGLYSIQVFIDSCTFYDTINIQSLDTNLLALGPDISICIGDTVLLDASYSNGIYTWQNGSTDSIYYVTESGLYSVNLEVDGCFFSDSIQITVNDYPIVDLGPDSLLCDGNTIILDAYIDGATYTWQNGSTGSNYIVTLEGTYTVTVDLNGCTSTDTVEISYSPIPIIDLGPNLTICEGDTVILNASFPNASYIWQDGSTDSIYYVTESGLYIVNLQVNDCYYSDSILITVNNYPIVDLGPDSLLCDGNTIILDAYIDGATYIWQDGSTNSNYIVSQEGTYTVTVDLNGCTSTDTVEIGYSPIPIIDLGPNLTICEGDTVILNASFPNASYTWQDGSTDSIYYVTQSGLYSVNLQVNDCYYSDSILITVNTYPIVDLGPDSLLCDGNTIILDAYVDGATYTWQNGSTNSNYLVSLEGTYSVTVDLNGCISTDTVEISYSPIPIIDLGPNLNICEGDTAILNASFPNAIYTWQDGSTDSIFLASATGTYLVDLYLNGCTFSDSITITVDEYPSFTLGNDTSICEEDFLTLDISSINGTYLWQDSTTSSIYIVNQTGTYSVEINNNGCISYDTIEVLILPLPIVELGEDISLCDGDSIVLDATYPGADYLWNTGSTDATITVDSSGVYSVTLNLNGCVYTNDIQITVHPIPEIYLIENHIICEGENYSIDASYPDTNANYLWMDGSTNSYLDPALEGLNSVTIELNGCYFTDSLFLEIAPIPEVNIEDTTICEGETYLFDATTAGGTAYQWQDGSQSPTFSANEEGWYIVEVENENCYTIDSAYLTLNTTPQNFLPKDTLMCEGDELVFNFENTKHTYLWQDSISSSSFIIDKEGYYSLSITNECGTSDFIMHVISEDCSCVMYIPNAFSPGNGGINESFKLFPDCELTYFSMKIFNRWGQRVFESKDVENEWDGTLRGGILAQDVYVYKLEYSFEEDRSVYVKNGTITLLK